jgi:hypothetical protein
MILLSPSCKDTAFYFTHTIIEPKNSVTVDRNHATVDKNYAAVDKNQAHQ